MSSSRLAALALEAELGLCRARLMSCAVGHVFLRRWTSLGFLRVWERGEKEEMETERETDIQVRAAGIEVAARHRAGQCLRKRSRLHLIKSTAVLHVSKSADAFRAACKRPR